MKVKKLIMLLKELDENLEIVYSSDSEMIQMGISGVGVEYNMWKENKINIAVIIE